MEEKEISYVVRRIWLEYTFQDSEYFERFLVYLDLINSPCLIQHKKGSEIYEIYEDKIQKFKHLDKSYIMIGKLVYNKTEDYFVTLNLSKLYDKNQASHPDVLKFVKKFEPSGYSIYTVKFDEKIKIHKHDNDIIVTIVGHDLDVKLFSRDIDYEQNYFE